MAATRTARIAGNAGIALLVMLAAAVPGGPRALAAGTPVLPGTHCPVFPTSNYWHARIDQLPLDARSDAWMAHMSSDRSLHPDFGPSYGAQSVPYGIPITVVDGAPRVRVTFMYADESDRRRYPLGRRTRIEGGSESGGDRHAIVVDRSTCTLFETWNTRRTGGRWTAGSGATWDLRANDLRPSGWTSADAAGLPILPGLLRWSEVKRGYVDHAIRFTTPTTSRAFIWPARHQAGSTDDAAYPPMGARFRLKASYSTAGHSPAARVVLEAMKSYGLVLADNGSAWYFQGDADPGWPAALVEELKSIPASAFEAVDTGTLQVSADSAKVRNP